MEKLSILSQKLIGSEIVRLGNEINERKKRGEKIYNFTIGDFDPEIFPIPQELEDKIISSYKKHYTNYPPADGVSELRSAVLQFLKEREGLDYAMNEIIIASGGRPLIYTLFKIVADEGDTVIYAAPSWNNNHYTNLNKAVHCIIEATPENNFMPTAEEIEPYIKGASLLCLCTPQNPTGTTLQKEAFEKICDLVIAENNSRGSDEKKLYVMFDQMYWTLTYGDTEHFNPVALRPEMKKYTIFIDGISKAFAATGVRVGWAFGPSEVIAKMKALLSHLGAWAPMAEQKAVAEYLLQSDAITEYLDKFKASLKERLDKIYEGIIALKEKGHSVDAISPQAAIYLTIKLDFTGRIWKGKRMESQNEVTDFLLNEARLAVVPFYAFGANTQSPWYRLSVGTCRIEDINNFLKDLEKALDQLGE